MLQTLQFASAADSVAKVLGPDRRGELSVGGGVGVTADW